MTDRPTNPIHPDDPDDQPTRIGKAGGDKAPDEERTVPSLQKGGAPNPAPKRPGNDPLIGTVLGGCRIDSLLGRGAMGAVYKARQLRLDRDVAVKIIRPEMMTDARTLKRFEVEARTVGRFNSAHVVMVHDVGFERGVHFLVMEFVQGKNLRDHVKLLAGGRLPAGEAIPLLRQACKGLEEAQRLGVIHRDIKPDNLMLTDRSVLKIADFGIAKPTHEDFSMTLTSELIGTPLYMSPEQCQGAADLDFRSDMYSLGATFYYLLTGEPPVRASSVYELIQTKTKLENLCLWKALPELDENHPLSRVIERMTALDREDRYESYEALLNDIVLVEQGRTVDRVAAKPKTELPKLVLKPPVKPSRARFVVAALLVVAATAGAYWWSTSRDPGARTDPAAASLRLQALRSRLEQDGPSDLLRVDVAAVAADGAQKAEQELLLADVEQGLAVRKRLQALAPPALELPFADLREHMQRVDAAVQVEGNPGKALQTWLRTARSQARAEGELGSKAQAKLASAFTQWQSDRGKAGGDKQMLAGLDQRLRSIEEGRRQLLDVLPTLRAAVDKDLPGTTLDAARRGLAEDGPSGPAVGPDVSALLTQIRADFDRDGPDDALLERARTLKPTRVEQSEQRDLLLKEIGRAKDRKNDAEQTRTGSYPDEPKVPFADVKAYFDALDRALQPLRDEQGLLAVWAANLRQRLRDEQALQAKVIEACRAGFSTWQAQSRAALAEPSALEARLGVLQDGIARAGELFPAAKAELDRLVPAAAIAQARTEVEGSIRRQQWLEQAQKLQRQLDGVTTLAQWRAGETRFVADLQAQREAAGPFAADPEVQAGQKRADDVRDRWVAANKAVTDLAGKIAAGDLSGAESLVRTTSLGVEDLKTLGEAAGRCREAFAALEEQLDVARSLALLGEARAIEKRLDAPAPDVDRRIQHWMTRLEAMQQAASGMVAIPAGRVRQFPDKVGAFFLDATEVSHGEFAKFLAELRAAVNGIDDPGKRLEAVAPRLSGVGLSAELLQALLDTNLRRVPDKAPADRLTWHAAAAFAAWNGKALPTLAEWSLAAFGDGNRHPYPWGQGWTHDSQQRNPDTKTLANVDDGGLSWRSAAGASVHHLAGNVAEWLAAEPDQPTAGLAGGRYNDSEPNAKEQAGGREFVADKTDTRSGFGARTVLRPRSFPDIQWPR